jgi:hypothetical protein
LLFHPYLQSLHAFAETFLPNTFESHPALPLLAKKEKYWNKNLGIPFFQNYPSFFFKLG